MKLSMLMWQGDENMMEERIDFFEFHASDDVDDRKSASV